MLKRTYTLTLCPPINLMGKSCLLSFFFFPVNSEYEYSQKTKQSKKTHTIVPMKFKMTFYNLRFEIFQPKLNANSEEGLNPCVSASFPVK